LAAEDVSEETMMDSPPRPKPPHVLHAVLSLDLGGLERLVLDLVRVGQRRGSRQLIVCIERPGKLADQARELGAEVFCLDKPPGRSTAAINDAATLLSKLRPDVVHTHQIGALWYLGQAARQERVPVVHTEHSDHVAHARGWWNKLKNRLRWRASGRLAQRFCCVSEDIARSVARWGTVPRGRIEVVLNGIDTELYADRSAGGAVRSELAIPAEARVVGTIGRLVEVKRQDLLLRAFAGLPREGAELRLLIVGDGPERPHLEALASELGIRERSIFAGYQSRPERYLQAMDIFALTSRHEGLPLALLEAWAAGVPIVSSAVGGVPKVVEHGRAGLLFASGDEAALIRSLRQLLGDASLATRLAEAGRAVVKERYSLERMADDYARQYQLAIAEVEGGNRKSP
jgi:glycosyltransferase involved in cell wall biosynthesis